MGNSYFYDIPAEICDKIVPQFECVECWRAYHSERANMQDDFVPQYFMKPEGKRGEATLGNCALSLWKPYRHALKCIRQMPALGDCLLRGMLVSEAHGPVMKGGRKNRDKNHLYWYQYKYVRPEEIFAIDRDATLDMGRE